MSANRAQPAKVWVWDGTLHELSGNGSRRVQASHPADTVVGMRDAVIVAAGSLPPLSVSGAKEPSGWIEQRQAASPSVRGYFETWQLLAPRASVALQDFAGIYRRWKRAGLLRVNSVDSWHRTLHDKVSDAIRDGWRVYAVSVFHLEPVALRRVSSIHVSEQGHLMARTASLVHKEPRTTTDREDLYVQLSGLQLTTALSSDSLLRRVVRMANRAVYSLGLDMGDAVIALHGSGRTAALSVEQFHNWGEWTSEEAALAWEEALLRFQSWYCTERESHAGNLNKKLLIGADPEFVLLRDNGRIAPADRYFGVGGGAGADALVVGRRIQYPIGEVRPDPAVTPDGLAANVRRQLIRAASRVSDPSLRWAAGAMPVPGVALGGHIHISGAALSSRMLRQLDRYVAMPVAMVESDNGRGRRPRYGALGDYRLQPHGGFEYRTLPSWLASPAAAKAAFALTLLCAKDTWALPAKPLMPEREEAAFYEGDRTELRSSLDSIAGELAGAPSYNEYARWIEPLFEAARRGAVWDESVDIRSKWRVGPFANL